MKTIAAILLIASATSVHAFLPTTGLWYNGNESGRGFNIEIQNSTMVVASYVFDDTGQQIWYTSSGTYSEATRTFSATFDGYSGGQCLGCSYSKPAATVAAGGNVRIIFSDAENGTLYFPHGSTPIHHLNYAYANKTDYFLGEWQFSFNTSGAISSQWVVFNRHFTGTDGTIYAAGAEDGVAGSSALATYSATSNSYLVAITDSTSTDLYLLAGDSNRMIGSGGITTGTTLPTANAFPAGASRLLTPTQLANGTPASHSSGTPSEQNDAALWTLEQAIMQARRAIE
jgi:hypothetical protein